MPNPFALANAAIFCCASAQDSPVHWPESASEESSSARYGKLLRIICDLIRHNHAAHRKAVFIGEFEVALVVGGNAHDGAGAIVGEDVICNPDRHKLAVEWIDCESAGIDAVLFDGAEVARLARGLLLREHLVDLRGKR